MGSPRAVNSACAEPLKQGKMSRPQGGPRYDNEIRLAMLIFGMVAGMSIPTNAETVKVNGRGNN